MNRSEFVEEYGNIVKKALYISDKARKEGLLALEEEIDQEKADEKDIFEYGLRFVVDGTDQIIIDKILSNIIKQEKDEQLFILKNIQKEAVLRIQEGTNSRLIYPLLNSFTDIPLNKDSIKN